MKLSKGEVLRVLLLGVGLALPQVGAAQCGCDSVSPCGASCAVSGGSACTYCSCTSSGSSVCCTIQCEGTIYEDCIYC